MLQVDLESALSGLNAANLMGSDGTGAGPFFEEHSLFPSASDYANKGFSFLHSNNKRIARKVRRNYGHAYVNSQGKFIPARKLGDDCKCPRKCFDRSDETCRKRLFDYFWNSGDYHGQTSYLFKMLEVHPVERRRPRHKESRRKYSVCYYIYNNQTKLKICKKAFMNIHGLQNSESRISRVINLKGKGIMSPPEDRRGRHGGGRKKSGTTEPEQAESKYGDKFADSQCGNAPMVTEDDTQEYAESTEDENDQASDNAESVDQISPEKPEESVQHETSIHADNLTAEQHTQSVQHALPGYQGEHSTHHLSPVHHTEQLLHSPPPIHNFERRHAPRAHHTDPPLYLPQVHHAELSQHLPPAQNTEHLHYSHPLQYDPLIRSQYTVDMNTHK